MSLIVRIRKKLSHFTLDVDFETADHFTCLLGASGSGKSMLLKCIAGLEKPDEGYIELNGRVLFDSSKKIDVKPQERGVGYLFQNYALFPNMTVKENILVSRYRERNRPEVIKRLHELISLLQLEGHEDKYPDRISGGQQQRTALARIMMSNPGILLLDEPFAALDANLREKLQMEMKDLLTEYGQQVIMSKNVAGQNYVTPVYDREDPLAKRHIALQRGPVMLAQENRLGYSVDDPIEVKINKDGTVDAIFPATPKNVYDCLLEMQIPLTDGSYMTVTDYGSAGKLWNEESKMAVWMFTKE